MSEALVTILKQHLETWRPNPEGFLFLNRNGWPYAANKVVEYGLWPVLDKQKIERAGMHAFRHCHASLLIEVGANPTVTKHRCGIRMHEPRWEHTATSSAILSVMQ